MDTSHPVNFSSFETGIANGVSYTLLHTCNIVYAQLRLLTPVAITYNKTGSLWNIREEEYTRLGTVPYLLASPDSKRR